MTKLNTSILKDKNIKIVSSKKALKSVKPIKWDSQRIVVGRMKAIREKLRGVMD